MNPLPGDPDLRELFGGAAPDARIRLKRFRAIKRRGRLLLALPIDLSEAAVAMELYPAQKRLPRLTKGALQTAAGWGLPLPFERIEQPLSGDPAFPGFLEGLVPGCTERDSGLGLLAGNPNATGRRFILLLFLDGQPAAIVKAGASPQARDLIRNEAAFLKSALRPGIERVIATFESESISAMAIRHVSGSAPREGVPAILRKTLVPWLDLDATLSLEAIPAWSRLSEAVRDQPQFEKIRSSLGERQIHPAIFHGDFAPWNIKVHPALGTWQIFDWERGELCGVPGWDWLHFEIQTAVLVRRESPAGLLPRLARLFDEPEFRAYTALAGTEGLMRPLTLAYLLYCTQVQRQTEGAAQIDALLQHASHEWNG